jgi:hypothetical protein
VYYYLLVACYMIYNVIILIALIYSGVSNRIKNVLVACSVNCLLDVRSRELRGILG